MGCTADFDFIRMLVIRFKNIETKKPIDV